MSYMLRFVYKDDTTKAGHRYLYRYLEDKETAERYAAQLNEIFGVDGFATASVEEMPCKELA